MSTFSDNVHAAPRRGLTWVPGNMESREDFTLRNSRIRLWLLATAAAAGIFLAVAPPSLWLCGVGSVLLIVGALVHLARTGQWFTWPSPQPSFNWFEGWATSTGVLLLILPLIALFARARWSA